MTPHSHDELPTQAGPPPTPPRDVGWYVHPTRPLEHRFWDGGAWTDWTDWTEGPVGELLPGPRRPVGAPAPAPGVAPAGDPGLVGSFAWDTGDDGLEWSSENYRVHGYEPGDVTPDLDLVLRHKLAQDRSRTERAMERCRAIGGPLSLHHQIVDAQRRLRVVVTVAVEAPEGVSTTGGRVYVGHVADVTDPATRAANEAVLAARVGNAAVQQAVGILGTLLDLPEDGVLAVLRRYSSHRNVPLVAIAQRVVDGARRPRFREGAKDPAAVRLLLEGAAAQR